LFATSLVISNFGAKLTTSIVNCFAILFNEKPIQGKI